MKRRDILDATKLLTRHKVDINNATLMVATQYVEGRRTGEIEKKFEDWLDEDIDEDDVDDFADELEEADPTSPEENSPLTTTKWPSSASSSKDSTPVNSGSST